MRVSRLIVCILMLSSLMVLTATPSVRAQGGGTAGPVTPLQGKATLPRGSPTQASAAPTPGRGCAQADGGARGLGRWHAAARGGGGVVAAGAWGGRGGGRGRSRRRAI